jgi:hypothetical protein
MLVNWSDADIDAAIAGAKAPVGNEVEGAGSAREAEEDAGADGAVADVAEVGDEAGADAVADADGATSGGEVEIVDKGKAKAEEAGGSDDNEDAGEGGHNDDDDDDDALADRPPKTRKTIAYDPLDVRSFRELEIIAPPMPVKSRAPRPLRMTAVKADPVDGSLVVSFRIYRRFLFQRNLLTGLSSGA